MSDEKKKAVDLRALYSPEAFKERFKAHAGGRPLMLSEQFGMYFLLNDRGEIVFRLNALIREEEKSP